LGRVDSRSADELDVGDVIVVDRSVGEIQSRTFATVVVIGARGPRISDPDYPTPAYASAFKIDGKAQYKKNVGRDDTGAYHLIRRDRDGFDVSRLRGAAKVSLTKYIHSELCDILEGRISAGPQRNSVENDVVDYLSDIAAGDAGHAIALLRRTVRHVAKRGEDRVAVGNVVTVRYEARKEIHERRIDTLGTHQRHLYEIIADAGEISVENPHETSEERVSESKAKSTRRKYLQSLERYDLVESEGMTRGKRYRVIRP